MTPRLAPAIALGAALAAGLPALAASAAEPRSAIPWLSQSLEQAPAPAERPRARPGRPDAAEAGDITVTPLGDISLDAVGILSSEETGFPRDLWGTASALRVSGLILDHRDTGVPEARALFRRLLLAEADPPPGSGRSAQVLIARVDRLLAAGALEEASALVTRAGVETPELFRRMFDIGLLLDEAQPACEALRRNPALSPTLPARIFCLARDGDWNAAEITLTLGRNVGSLSDEEELALARFLDPELFEHLPVSEPPDPFTPLDFLLREAVGLPRPPGPLPTAFLHHDLAEYLPLRTRILAAERLALEQAVGDVVLFTAYRAGQPAASGGIWDRAAALQALDAALEAGEPEVIAAALARADEALTARGLRVAFAREVGPALGDLDPGTLDAEARARAIELLLLADAGEAAADLAGNDAPPRVKALLAMAGAGRLARGEIGGLPALHRAALEGLAAAEAPSDVAARLEWLVGEGRTGETILAALDLVADGTRADPAALRAALYGLRLVGQEPAARRIALQSILAEGDIER